MTYQGRFPDHVFGTHRSIYLRCMLVTVDGWLSEIIRLALLGPPRGEVCNTRVRCKVNYSLYFPESHLICFVAATRSHGLDVRNGQYFSRNGEITAPQLRLCADL